MRRSTAKSRGDKGRTDSVPGIAASVQLVETVDIVPGRLTESTWTSMLSQEDGEEVVVDIIAELMEGVMDRCYQVYLQRQVSRTFIELMLIYVFCFEKVNSICLYATFGCFMYYRIGYAMLWVNRLQSVIIQTVY